MRSDSWNFARLVSFYRTDRVDCLVLSVVYSASWEIVMRGRSLGRGTQTKQSVRMLVLWT